MRIASCRTEYTMPAFARSVTNKISHLNFHYYVWVGCEHALFFYWEYWLSGWEYLEPMMQQLHSFLLFCCCEEKLQHINAKESS